MKLGDIVRTYREENGISQREFARRCGLSNSIISIIEKGYNPQTGNIVDPDSRTIRSLAEGMAITERELRELLLMNNPKPSALTASFDQDQLRLEALHKDPRLGLLFDRTRKMKTEDVDFMLQMAQRILNERDGDDA